MKAIFSILKGFFGLFVKLFPYFFKAVLIGSIAGGVFFTGGAYVVWVKEKSRVKANLDKYKSEVTNYYDSTIVKPVKIVDKNGELIGEFFRKNYKPIRTDNLKDHATLVWALLSSEDREFYRHSGINYKALGRAFFINIIQFKLSQGGSTITQQLAKLSLALGERNIFNKITEAFCTYYIENQYDKETILTMYMNQIFMGEGNTGLEEASRYYFNKSAAHVSPAEAALLIGVIPAPSVYNPVKNLKIAMDRQKRILQDMGKQKHLHFDPDKIDKKYDEKIEKYIAKFTENYKVKEIKSIDGKVKYASEIGKSGYDRDFRVNLAPDFNDSIRNFILGKFTSEDLERKSITVHTTLDREKQSAAQSFLQAGVDVIRKELESRRDVYKKKGNDEEFKREKDIIEGMNGSLVSINPFNGNIEALVGAYKISNIYRLNRAEDSRRQPGSVIKALVYALALEKKVINPSSIVVDEKLNINGYSPKNWYGTYKGNMTARQALAQSVNTVSVKLMQGIGVEYFVGKLAKILDVSPSELEERMGKNLALALGSGELTPLELALVYSTVANGGYKVKPKKILKITDSEGIELYSAEQENREQIIDSTACAMAVNMMEAVLSEEGTMNVKLKESDKFPMAGKTGTVQTPAVAVKKWGGRKGVRDSWFAGIIPGLVTSIWIGNDQGAPFPGSGSGNSGQVFVKYALFIKRKIGVEDALIRPFDSDFVRVDICGETGEALTDASECKYPLLKQYYYKGEEPKNQIDQKIVEDLKRESERLEFEMSQSHEGQGTELPPTEIDKMPIESPPVQLPSEKQDSTEQPKEEKVNTSEEKIPEKDTVTPAKDTPPPVENQ